MTTKANIPKRKQQIIRAADLWCGGGGTSTGLMRAAIKMGFKLELTAINHWEIAVATHSKNHPDARHLCKAVDSVNPLELYTDRKLDILVASPECVHHSRARGGKPRDEQKRADAWDLQRWLEKLYVKTLLIENVEEFIDWGPLKSDGTPDKRHKGKYFKQFIDFLNILYTVEYRVLNCADYGDATTRKRFFLIAKRGKNKKIFFPEPTHASRAVLAKNQPGLYEKDNSKALIPWIPARDIINWNLKGKNVFGRKKALSDNTMKRIFAGLRKYSGIDIPEREIFVVSSLLELVPKKKRKDVTELHAADFSKILKKQKHLITPDTETFIRDEKGKIIEHRQSPSAEVLEKLRAENQIKADEIYQISPIKFDLTKFNPFVLQNEGFFRGNAAGRDIDEPIPTVTSRGGGAVITPFIMGTGGPTGQMRPRSSDEPVRTILTDHRQNVFEPFMVNLKGTERRMRDIGEPTFTQTTVANQQMLIQPFMIQFFGERVGQEPRTRSIDEPAWTVTPQIRQGIVEPFLVKMEDVKGKIIHGLLLLELGAILVINFRMLHQTELAAAMSFPADYYFHGTRDEQVKQIGNAVPTKTAEQLCMSALED